MWSSRHPQAVIDYIVRASHVTALAGKAIVERYHAKAPRPPISWGAQGVGSKPIGRCRSSPRTLMESWPVLPALESPKICCEACGARVLLGGSMESLSRKADLELLHQAVVAKCDMNDGPEDGLIRDPRACHFSPTEVRCPSGKTSQCLTASQIEAVEKIYMGPVTLKGEQITAPGAMKGSELNWFDVFSFGSGLSDYLADWFRYYYLQPNPGPAWKPENLDFDHDYTRFGMGEMTDPVDPDLRRFKATGAKLLVYTGWNDQAGGVLDSVDYYETAEKIIGQREATQEFFRLFVIPGMDHCTGGDGAFDVDYLSYLEAWVEGGKTPEKLIGAHSTLKGLNPENSEVRGKLILGLEFPLDPATVTFSRPIYPYPIGTRYLGHGDPNDAASFLPANP